MKKRFIIASLLLALIFPCLVSADLINVTCDGVDGNLVCRDVSGNIIYTIDATNRKLTIPSGSTLEVLGTASIVDGALAVGDMALPTGSLILGTANKGAALDAKGDGKILIGNGTTATMQTVSGDVTLANTGAVTIGAKKVTAGMTAIADGKVLIGGADGAGAEQTLTGDVTVTNAGVTAIGAKKVTAGMTAIADGKVLIGGADGAGAEQTLTGDVTVTNAGVTAIGAGKVTNAMLANGAGVGALLTAGLGGSLSVTKTSAATDTIVAANATKDRAVIVLVIVDETYAIGTGTLPTVKIGEDDAIEKAMAATVLDTEAAGTVLAFAFTNTATKKIIATTTAAEGDATGGCSIIVLALPTT